MFGNGGYSGLSRVFGSGAIIGSDGHNNGSTSSNYNSASLGPLNKAITSLTIPAGLGVTLFENDQ